MSDQDADAPRHGGRQTIFTEELADRICERLLNGDSLRQICADESMPNRSTVYRWMDENEAFAAKCARAREAQGDYMDDLIYDEARECTNDNFQAARVRISAYQWRASKLKPKKYGDRITQEHTGPGGAPLEQPSVRITFPPNTPGEGTDAGESG